MKIFLSCVSVEFRSYRRKLANRARASAAQIVPKAMRSAPSLPCVEVAPKHLRDPKGSQTPS
jgi:hypothetical protein